MHRNASLWTVIVLLGAAASAAGSENLVVDASFESPLPAWFAVRSGTSYFAAKQTVAGAADGRKVLAIEAWDRGGCRVLAPAIAVPTEAAATGFSGTAMIRSVRAAAGATIELALFDERGAKKLASFGQLALPTAHGWQTIARAGVKLPAGTNRCRLGLALQGPSDDARVEVDQVGLFAGATLGKVDNNDDLFVVEAEALADGVAWIAKEHYAGWYNGTPSGLKLLTGAHALKPRDNRPVRCPLTVRQAGPHTLWVRYLAGPYPGRFTLALQQGQRVAAEKTFVENDPLPKRGYSWEWASMPVDLQPGPAELVLTRPEKGASWVTRQLDLFVLTNRAEYAPQIEHFQPKGYLRFTNLDPQAAPYCLWVWVRRMQGPHWYSTPGMLTRAGLSEGHVVPRDAAQWLQPNRPSPWVPISDYLLAAGGRNNVQLTATRRTHTDGFLEGTLRGRLELATGDDQRLVRSIEYDQQGGRMLLTLPVDFAAHPEAIKTAREYIAETEAELARLPPLAAQLRPLVSQPLCGPAAPPAGSLNLASNLSLQAGLDDAEVVRREIGILRGLGFNQTYHRIAPVETVVPFCAANNLLPRFGEGPALWTRIRQQSPHHPDVEAMEESAAEFADTHRAVLPCIVRDKLMDEPGGMSYEALARSPACRQKFVDWLRTQGLTPQKLGLVTWDDVAPITPAERARRPELFYYSGLFRLEAFSTLARACVAAKRKSLPHTMPAYVNYSPPTGGGSWTERGIDPFSAQRHGGLEMFWTEDWLGYSLGPQHLSDTLALGRCAGHDAQRLGAYCVGQGTPTLMRMKYYTLAAGGARDIECYDYGPWYAGIDSWARRFELYAAIRDCNFELRSIDAALQAAKRRPTPVAILYNTTASLWAEERDNSILLDGGFIHWALAHAGYDADFLNEEDVEQGRLERYRVLYLEGPQLRRAAAQRIASWVQQGGVLCGTAGAAGRDEFNRPLDVLEPVFAARSREFQVVGSVGRPKFDLPGQQPRTTLAPAPHAPPEAVDLPQMVSQESLQPLPGGRTILVTDGGRAAGVLHAHGRGTALRLAALPGVAYAYEAAQPPYDRDSYLPQNFRTALRDFIAWPARLAGVPRVAAADCPIAEIVRYDGPHAAVIFLIDHRAAPTQHFAFDLPQAARLTHAQSAAGQPVTSKPQADGSLHIDLPLNVADALVLSDDKR